MPADGRKYTTNITIIFTVYLLNRRFWPINSYLMSVIFYDDGVSPLGSVAL